MKKIIANSGWLIALLLTVMNLWMWDSQLQFSNYSENNLKMAVLQLVHVILIIAELWLLMQLGRTLKRHRLGRTRVITTWLVLVAYGAGSVLLQLVWKNQFYFSDLLNAVFPITRNIFPLATAYIIAMATFPRVNELSEVNRRFLGKVLVGMFLVATVFYNDLWGIKDSQNVLFYLMVMMVGAAFDGIELPDHWRRFVKRWGTVTLLVTAVLAMLMPTISVTIHYDMSTANRFSNLSDGLLVLVTLGMFLLQKNQVIGEHQILNGGIYSSLVLAGLPLLRSHYVGFAAGHVGNLGLKILLVAIIAGAVMVVGFVANWCLRRLFSSLAITQHYERWVEELPSHLMEWPAWLKKFCHRHWPALTAVGVAYGLAVISNLLMFTSWKVNPAGSMTFDNYIYLLTARQGTLLFTALLIWLVFKLVQSLVKRYWLALSIVVPLIIIWGIANRIKLITREEPILPSDVMMYQAYGNMLKLVSAWIPITGAVVYVITIGLGIYLDRKLPVPAPSTKRRCIWTVLTVLFFGSSIFWNHTDSRISTVIEGLGDHPIFYNQQDGARENGPIIQFLNNIDITVMEKPAGYSKARMEKIAREYQVVAEEINKDRKNSLSSQTIMFNLSESFSNPKRVPGVKIKGNPIPYILSLKKTTTSGLMMSSGYGGGTANMEYMTLTGLATANFSSTLQTPYTQIVPRLTKNWTFNQLFDYAVGIHPYQGVFYSRVADYAKFGFNRFYYLGSKYKIIDKKKIGKSPYLSDETSYANALTQLKADKNGTFINLVTMQNHMPYDTQYYKNYSKWLPTSVSEGTDKGTVATYTTGLTYTDKAVKQFIKQINKIQKPITVVFYGDHLPGIYNNSMAKDGTKLHETDYFIYSNTYAREHGARTLTSNTKVVSPNDFMAMVAEQTNSKVTPYLALMTKVYEDLPAVSINTGQNNSTASLQFTNSKGQVVKYSQLTKKQKRLWQDYKLVQYDLTAGKQYLYQLHMMK